MPNFPNRPSLMGAMPAARTNRMQAMHERVGARQGGMQAGTMPGMPPRTGNTGIVPPHMQQPRGPAPQASLNAGARPMRGQPAAPAGINAQPGGVMVPDAARAPRMRR